MLSYKIRDDFIKLGQLLKACDLVGSGAEAKEEILSGNVKVNGEVCTMRGKKCIPGDVISFHGEEVTVEGERNSL